MCFETLRQIGFSWFYLNDTGSMTVLIIMTIVVIVAYIFNASDVVSAMMGVTIQLCLVSVVTASVEVVWMTMVARLNMM